MVAVCVVRVVKIICGINVSFAAMTAFGGLLWGSVSYSLW